MHTRLFGVCLTYVLLFSLLMNFAELASFPPSAFEIPINFNNIVWFLPNIGITLEFSWSNAITLILTATLTALAAAVIYSLAAQSFDLAYTVQIILGVAFSFGVSVTMLATVGSLLPSWLHLFFIYMPCILLIYSVLDIGGA